MKILENQLKAAEYVNTDYRLTAPTGITPDDLIEPESWVHVAQKLRAGDEIRAMAEDASWYARVVILAVKAPLVHVALLEKHEFKPVAGKEHDAYDVVWKGPAAKWCVLRKSDNAVMEKLLDQKSDGVAWVEANAGKPVEPLKKAA